jgi:transposase
MWVFCGGLPEHPTVLFRYHPTRSGQVALSFLDEYRGFIQSDGYIGYDYLGRKQYIVLVACWAHVRRKFVEVVKARKKVRGGAQSPKGLADEALEFIGKLYLVEKQCRSAEMSADQIYKIRQQESKPVLHAFKIWLDEKQSITPPKGLLGQAINYALSLWSRLVEYIEDGRLKPDNNAAENAIRPFVLGRKNFLFAGHPKGAAACATFFSLIETAKANGLEPFSYLRHVFEKLPLVQTSDEYRALLPQHVDRTVVNCLRP